MKLIAIASVFLSTAPILALNAAPKANEAVLAVFDQSTETDVMKISQRLGLDVISYDPSIGHLIVQDHDGSSTRSLYGMGARLVIDADLFATCFPEQYRSS